VTSWNLGFGEKWNGKMLGHRIRMIRTGHTVVFQVIPMEQHRIDWVTRQTEVLEKNLDIWSAIRKLCPLPSHEAVIT